MRSEWVVSPRVNKFEICDDEASLIEKIAGA
jgi:hypothetical protein